MIIVLIIIILMLCVTSGVFEQEQTVCSNNDGNCYKISTRYNTSTYSQASDELARINTFNAKFITYLRNKYIYGTIINTEMQAITTQLIANYNPDALKENDPVDEHNTSYVLDKGTTVAFCLREKDSGDNNFENHEMLNFVNIHEISHLAMSYHDPTHGDEFWKTFKILLNEAIEAGLYKPIDWNNNPKNYCGMKVDYNPYYDNSIVLDS